MIAADSCVSSPRLAQALFTPKTVALVGASGDAKKNTARPQRFLVKHGYGGRIVPINPTRDEILGLPAFPSLSAAHATIGQIDHAYIMSPGDSVEAALDDCGACGIPVAAIFSDGFADVGEAGIARQARLTARARALGVRVLGPNSMGVMNIAGRTTISVNATLETDQLLPGRTSVISQSGTMLGTLMSRGAARGLGYAKMISVGNEADLGVGELLDLLVDDADTDVILLFLETVRDAARLAQAARRAHAAGKPVVVYKLGRSALGEAMARSHTGALAGSDKALDAFFRDCGIIRVETLETLIEIAPLVARRRPALKPSLAPTLAPGEKVGLKDCRPSCGTIPRRVAVVTTTGGGAASVVDRLGLAGIDTMIPNAALTEALQAHGVRVTDSPIVDLTMAGTGARYAAVLRTLIDSPECDAVLAVVGSSAQFHPEVAVQPILQTPWAVKPVVAFLTPHADASLTVLAQQGIAAFRTPEACADALAAFLHWTPPRNALKSRSGIDSSAHVLEEPIPTSFNEASALQLFARLGVPVVPHAIAQAPAYTHNIAYPVAAKVLSRDIAHKTEAGGVLLGILSEEAYQTGVSSILARVREHAPSAQIEGVLVQAMVKGLAEVILGYRHDAMVGPTVVVGMGGVLAEIYQDVALRLAPVSESEAHEMLAEVKGLAVLRGYRNLPQGDLDALARAVAAFSQLALLPGQPIAEAEINPLMVLVDGVAAVDGLVALRE